MRVNRLVRPNVLQHQYAIVKPSSNERILATKGIWTCTAWYGWDVKSGVCFLCHFDAPWSANSVPKILEDLRLAVGKEHKFHSVLVGGKGWFLPWSKRTRKEIINHVIAQNDLNIFIRNGPYDNCLWKHRDLVLSSLKKRKVSVEELSGAASCKGFFWIFKPMQRIEV